MNFRQIIEAWTISFNPTPKQRALAELRGKVCDECPSKITVLKVSTCKECGCPIGKKIFTNEYNPCPLEKWGEIDDPFMKKTKTLV